MEFAFFMSLIELHWPYFDAQEKIYLLMELPAFIIPHKFL